MSSSYQCDVEKRCLAKPDPKLLHSYEEAATRRSWRLFVGSNHIFAYLIVACFFASLFLAFTDSDASVSSGPVNWKSCGDAFEGYQCANISLPLDYHNESDPRNVTISVNRYLATNVTHRQGAIFMNPGGPGGSGTSSAFAKGIQYSKVLKGQYDIIGFDPRGVNQSRPYLSCFESQLDSDVFASLVDGFSLNLPVNITSEVELDLQIQVNRAVAEMTSLAAKCFQRVGDSMEYFGTEAVVRDIDAMSRVIEGEEARVNFWGFSYGTIIGQYMIKVLPPHRIGRIMIDGVVNPDVWSSYPIHAYEEGLDNIDDVLSSFAASCSSAGDACALSSLKPAEILSRIDETLTSLYYTPVPVTDLQIPAIATTSGLRRLLFLSMYRIQSWPQLAEHLDNAFRGNMSGIVNATMHKVDSAGATKSDNSAHATLPIFCADTKPYDSIQTPPTNADLAFAVLLAMQKYSYRMGDGFFSMSMCHVWQGVSSRRSRYEGTFDMKDGTLDTPVLVLSNTYDPVTSLASAMHANEQLGDNARLVQQVDGWGHCTTSQKSFCTAEIVSAYMVDGKVPEVKHTLCQVDEKPFVPFNESLFVQDGVDTELRKAWSELTMDWSLL